MTSNRLLLTEDTLFWAFRYALGRRTYAVSMVVDEILGVWDELTLRTREQIVREILEAQEKDRSLRVLLKAEEREHKLALYSHLGMDMDKDEWFKLVNKFKQENLDEYRKILPTR